MSCRSVNIYSGPSGNLEWPTKSRRLLSPFFISTFVMLLCFRFSVLFFVLKCRALYLQGVGVRSIQAIFVADSTDAPVDQVDEGNILKRTFAFFSLYWDISGG